MKKVVPLRSSGFSKKLSKLEAQDFIHSLAQQSANIKYTAHARERIKLRGFTLRDVERILQRGIIMQEPRLGEHGDWSYLVQYIGLEGRSREAGCVTMILRNKALLIKTVEWIDI